MNKSRKADQEYQVTIRIKFRDENLHMVPHNLAQRSSQILTAAYAELIDDGIIDIHVGDIVEA